MTPSNWLEVPPAPAVRMEGVAPLLLMVPVPSRPSMVMLKPLTSRAPALATVRVLFAERPVALPMARVPVEIFVAPEKVLFPERVRVPVPVLVRAMVPAPFWIFPEKAEV